MSLLEAANIDYVHPLTDRLSSKRKLDDYVPSDSDDGDDSRNHLVSAKMRKGEFFAVSLPLQQQSVSEADIGLKDCSHPSSSRFSVQFFVRMMSEGKTLVLQANLDDTVKSIHERIQSIAGIPLIEQRLIYRGKQLQWEQTISQCGIQNDAGLQLVGRMRSTHHPLSWQVMDEMVSHIFRLCKGETKSCSKIVMSKLTEFLTMTPRNNADEALGHLQIFLSSCAPAALVMLYMSPHQGNRKCADDSIRQFINSSKSALPKPIQSLCAPIVLEFCKLLRRAAHEKDPLYTLCRSYLGSMVDCISIENGSKTSTNSRGVVIAFQDIFMFVKETASRLSLELESSIGSTRNMGPSSSNIQDFIAFLQPVLTAILEQVGTVSLPICEVPDNFPCYAHAIMFLHKIFNVVLGIMETCLRKVEECLLSKDKRDGEDTRLGWCHYLPILKELNNISMCFEGANDQLLVKLKHLKVSICHLIITYTRRHDDQSWLLQHKEVTDFESRRHLVMMMLPELKDDYEELHEMLIDRLHLLAESFEYIAHADKEALHSGLFVEFKHEEATGPGVLREWFFLVCQQIFDPENALFVACPNDRGRFFPSPASKGDPLHRDYFLFAGRVIALALMHKLQVGVVFDRVFFLQLAGKKVSLEDICDADPCMYNSCKKILELEAETVDSDALGLTFVREVEQLGSRAVVELCPGGKSITVNSSNRVDYVNRLIEHRFVESIKDEVALFAQGFADIMCNSGLQQFFFQSLELQDLDWMLRGCEIAISVEDWKAHTEYNGFKETDPQIIWFWEIVDRMSSEQKKLLLFFWTSLKCLPVEGFRGLASRLYIYKSNECSDHLPSSHTCFYRICFPAYPSMAVMQNRLNIITHEHVSSSFGTW